MPGAWLHTPANTRLTTRSAPAEARGVGVDAFVAGHRVDPFADRAVGRDAVAHPLQVVGPRDLVQRGEVHQDLAVDPEVVQEPDVRRDERGALVVGELVAGERALPGRPGTPAAGRGRG